MSDSSEDSSGDADVLSERSINTRNYFSGWLARQRTQGRTDRAVLYDAGTVRDFYTLGRKLGEGGQGKVYEGKDMRSGVMFAVKTMRLPRPEPEPQHRRPKNNGGAARRRGTPSPAPDVEIIDLAEEERRLIEREIEVMRDLGSHKHLVSLQRAFAGERTIYLVLDLCVGGNLYEYLRVKGRLKEIRTVEIIGQMVTALAHVHGRGYVHRDVKAENILFTDNETLSIKLADFGLCCKLADAEELGGSVVCGTTVYMSPEVLRREKQDGRVDVWALGVLAYECITGRLPFDGRSERHTEKMIVEHRLSFDDRVWDGVTTAAEDFVASCLRYWPSERLAGVRACAEHAWLRSWTEPPVEPGRAKSPEPGGDMSKAPTVEELLKLHRQRQFKRVQTLLFKMPKKEQARFRAAVKKKGSGKGKSPAGSGAATPVASPVPQREYIEPLEDSSSPADEESPPAWEPDDASSVCRGCAVEFTFLNRRHHCRRCGRLFCKLCSAHRMVLPFTELANKPVRVCNDCALEGESRRPAKPVV